VVRRALNDGRVNGCWRPEYHCARAREARLAATMTATGPLELAAAAQRLRKRPGRPPLSDEERERRARERRERRAAELAALAAIPPRCLPLEVAARYLGGVGTGVVRNLIDAGVLPRVVLPSDAGKDLRRVLVDREDLDALISRSKELPQKAAPTTSSTRRREGLQDS
jgi:hypothetical protein